MKANRWWDRALWLSFGLIAAFAVSYFLFANEPVAASTGDRSEDVIMCTGLIDNDGEGIFVLDTVTGDLKGWVMDTRSNEFRTGYAINVLDALEVNVNSNPEFTMTTGMQTFRPARGQSQLANIVIYVGESTSGKIAAFGVPWGNARRSNATPLVGAFVPLDKTSFRDQGAIR